MDWTILLTGMMLMVDTSEEPVVITPANAQNTFQTHSHMLVEFFASDDQECNRVHDLALKSVHNLRDLGYDITFGMLNMAQFPQHAAIYGVQDYPLLLYFYRGNKQVYKSEYGSLEEWLKKKISKQLVPIDSREAQSKFINDNEKCVVIYDNYSGLSEDEYTFLAKRFENLPIGIVTDLQLHFEFTSEPYSVYYYEDGARYGMYTDYSLQNIKYFILERLNPYVFPYDSSAGDFIFKYYHDTLLIFSRAPELELALRLNKLVRDKIYIGMVDIDTPEFKTLVQYLNLNSNRLPNAIIVEPSKRHILRYRYDYPLDLEKLRKFVNDWYEDKLIPWTRSEETDNEGKVVTLSVDNYAKVINDENLNVLIEFNSPWCPHCQRLQPELQRVAEAFKENESVVISKIDVTKNEVPQYTSHGFATIWFYPRHNKNGIVYTGCRTSQSLIEFINKFLS